MSGEINTVDLGGISADLLYGCERFGFPVVTEKFLALRDDGPRLTERP
jgi:hypothetical protein